MGEAPCTELDIRRARVAEVALAMAEGRIPLLNGAQELTALQPDVDPGDEDRELALVADAARHSSVDVDDASLRQACRVLAVRYAPRE